MLNVKQLLNSTKNIDFDTDDNDKRHAFMWEIINVLSNKSRDDKQEMIELKRRIRTVLDFDPSRIHELEEFKDFRKKIQQLLTSDKEADWIFSSLNVMQRLKDIWQWNGGCLDEDEEFNNMPEESKEQFIAIAKRFTKYADNFYNLYLRIWTDYILKHKSIPNYRYLLKKLFCQYVERHIKNALKNIQFSEEECKEWFWAIQECLEDMWLNLEASDNLKKDFIKLCREKFPLAAKKDDFLFENKNFKQDFLKFITNWLDKYLEKTFDHMVEDCIKDADKNDFELDEDISPEYQRRIYLLSNTVLGTISTINWLMDDWSWEDNAIGWYFWCIADQFEYDHQKKLKRNSAKNTPERHKQWLEDNNIFIPENVKTWWETNLSEQENNLIKEAVSYIDCKNQRSIIKYITKLKMKDLPIRFDDFKRLFNLKEIPPQTETILIDQLWMDYEVEEDIKVKGETSEKKAYKNKDKIKSEVYIPEEVVIENPTQYLVDKLKNIWCIIDNELTAKKQINEFCQNENYKTVLINLMSNPKFGKIFIHKPGHKTARLLRIGRTGWRILFEKRKDGNLHFVCFGNHDYYEDRLAKLK